MQKFEKRMSFVKNHNEFTFITYIFLQAMHMKINIMGQKSSFKKWTLRRAVLESYGNLEVALLSWSKHYQIELEICK